MPGSGQIRLLRRRIKSVTSMKKITRAMEMIAASRILRAQRLVMEARPYAEQITEIIRGLAASTEAKNHPLLIEHETVRTVGLIVISSDRGLAGAYNSNVLRLAERKIAEEEAAGLDVRLYLAGRKAEGYFKYRGRAGARVWTGITDNPGFLDAHSIGSTVIDAYSNLELDRVWLIYTDFRSSLTQTPNAMRLLPVDVSEFEGGTELPAEFMFEPGPEEILGLLIPRYLDAKVFHAMLESSASEHASRQRAMKSATDNAEDVVSSLTRIMNQARQEQITTEISEIVGGAEALKSGR